MPERPDLEYVVPLLHAALVDRTVQTVTVKKPVVMRMLVTGGVDVFKNTQFKAVKRHGHFVLFETACAPSMVVSPMLAGRFSIVGPKAKLAKDVAVIFELDDGQRLLYSDEVQMGKVYIGESDKLVGIPGFLPLGMDVLDRKKFTLEWFAGVCKKRADQVKVFLMDKSVLDSMGNAYADEVCWEAKIHPKTRVRSLKPAQVERLHVAIISVLTNARDEIARRAGPMDKKIRDFLAVRGRAGEPCRRCGTKIRSAGVHGHDAEFCPVCQPDENNTSIVDWRQLDKTTTT